MRCPSAEDNTIKPKATIPLKRLISVNEIQEDDKKKFKKLAKAPDVAFKVSYLQWNLSVTDHIYLLDPIL